MLDPIFAYSETYLELNHYVVKTEAVWVTASYGVITYIAVLNVFDNYNND